MALVPVAFFPRRREPHYNILNRDCIPGLNYHWDLRFCHSKYIHEIKERLRSHLWKKLLDITCKTQQATFIKWVEWFTNYHFYLDRWSLCSLCRTRCHSGTGYLQCQWCQGGLWWPQRPLLHADGLSAWVGDAIHWSVYTLWSLYFLFFSKLLCQIFSWL